MDIDLEKELKVRRRILAIYNKDLEDFGSKQEYDDYLEEMEVKIFNLANGVNVEQTEAEIRRYRQQNQEQINAKSARQANLDVVAATAQLSAAQLAAAAAPKPGPPSLTGGLPTILPKLAANQDALLDAGRNIVYGRTTMEQAKEGAAAAGGWSKDLQALRLAQEAFASLLLPPAGRLVEA